MKNKTYIVIFVILAAAGLLVWSRSNEDRAIKIGVVGPFTGNAAVFGDFMQRGLDLVLAKLDSADRERVKIIKEDDMCSGKNAISAVQKLITVDQVNYVIGPLCNESSIATENLFEDNKVVSVTIGLPSNKIADMGPYHFSFSPEIEYLMETIAKYISSHNLKKIAVIHMVAPFEEENYRHFARYILEEGVSLAADEALPKGATDFKNAILKIKRTNPDSLMIIAHTGELNNILKQLGEQGLSSLPKFGIHAAETPVLLQVKELAEGLAYAYPADKIEIASAQDYAEIYKAKYGISPDPSSVNVYDSFNILVGAIHACGYENRVCVQEKLATLSNYQGANGNLSVDERGVGTYKEIMIKMVKDGKFEKLE